MTEAAATPRFSTSPAFSLFSRGFVFTPRSRISTVMIAHNTTSSVPLMNCTQVVDTMPAVITINVTMQPTSRTPT